MEPFQGTPLVAPARGRVLERSGRSDSSRPGAAQRREQVTDEVQGRSNSEAVYCRVLNC